MLKLHLRGGESEMELRMISVMPGLIAGTQAPRVDAHVLIIRRQQRRTHPDLDIVEGK
jgi:hypothetical protein